MYLEWEYHFNNYGTDKSLAALKSDNLTTILQVFKSENFYFSKPNLEYDSSINPYEINIRDIHDILKSSNIEINPINEFTCACRLIKKDFKEQSNI